MAKSVTIELRVKVPAETAERVNQDLVDVWLEDEGITIHTAGGQHSADVTWVKAREPQEA